MSDTEYGIDPPQFNYDNCIVTQNEDSEDSNSSGVSVHFRDQMSQNNSAADENDPSSKLTHSHIANAKLSPNEAFIFMVGMLSKIDKYLNTLNEGDDRGWLIKQIDLVKTVLIDSSKLFKIKEVLELNGQIYFRDKPVIKKTRKKQKISTEVKNPEAELVTNEIEDCVPEEEDKGKPNEKPDVKKLRHSKRISNFQKEVAKGNVGYFNRMEYVAFRNGLSLSTPGTRKINEMKSEQTQQKRSAQKSVKKKINKSQTSNLHKTEFASTSQTNSSNQTLSKGKSKVPTVKNVASNSLLTALAPNEGKSKRKQRSNKRGVKDVVSKSFNQLPSLDRKPLKSEKRSKSLGMQFNRTGELPKIWTEKVNAMDNKETKGQSLILNVKNKINGKGSFSANPGNKKIRQSNIRKRRGVSLDRGLVKKVKKSEDKRTEKGRRTLYAEDSWLNSLTVMNETLQSLS